MYEMLKEQFDFKGSDRSVRLYVAKRKKELQEQSESVALPLETKPATAQVDFAEAPFVYKGERVILPFLALSFPYSNGFYFCLLKTESAFWKD